MTVQEDKLRLPGDIVIKRRGRKYLFLNPTVPDWTITNFNGAWALRLCNGRRTAKEINSILKWLGCKDNDQEILHFFSEVSNTKLFLAQEIHPQPSETGLRTVHLNLTEECNLRCIYCYAEERSNDSGKLQFQEYVNLVNDISNISPTTNIVFTGGEPLLKDFTLDLAQYTKKMGHHVHLLTNGILINEKNSKAIAEIFDLVKISLDGSTPEIHEFHRGSGTFYKTLAAIDRLAQEGAHVKIAMTVTKINKNDIGSMAKKFGPLLSIAPLFKAGRAKSNNNLSISGKEYYKALASVKGVNPLSSLCDYLSRAKQKRIMNCGMGKAEISISDTGDVYPCHLLHLRQFHAGNVRMQPLESIYQNSGKLRFFRELNVLEIKGCKKCDIRFICGGACRARAFYEKNRIDVSDNFCKYEKMAFINGLFEVHQLL